MGTSRNHVEQPPGTTPYEIRLQGHLAARWAAWFDEMALTCEGDGTTLITGPVKDQAALHGLLHKVRDTGLPLISVTALGPDCPGRARASRDQPTDYRRPTTDDRHPPEPPTTRRPT